MANQVRKVQASLDPLLRGEAQIRPVESPIDSGVPLLGPQDKFLT
jgi:hypothetical protein